MEEVEDNVGRVMYASPFGDASADSGTMIRQAAIKAAMSELGHSVVEFTCMACQGQSEADRPSLAGPRPRLLERPVRFMGDDDLVRLDAVVRKEHPQLVVLRHPGCSDYVPLAVRQGIAAVVDAHNFELSINVMRSVGRPLYQHAALAFGEAVYLRRANRVWTVSDLDAMRYRRWYRLDNVATIPNCMPDPGLPPRRSSDHPELLFVGAYGYPPNERAAQFLAEELMPLVWSRLPDARLVLAGKEPRPWMMAARSARVLVTGRVPDLGEYYARAALVLVPVAMGGGTKYKFLEAMAYGKAIVSNREGAAGIQVKPGHEFVLTPLNRHAFAASVVQLLADPERCALLGHAAREAFVRSYTVASLTKAIAAELLAMGCAA